MAPTDPWRTDEGGYTPALPGQPFQPPNVSLLSGGVAQVTPSGEIVGGAAPGGPAGTPQTPKPYDQFVQNLPGGRVRVLEYAPLRDERGEIVAWDWFEVSEYEPAAGDGGAGLSYQLGMSQLQESIRQFNIEQAETRKQRAIESASNALQNFLQAQSLADARRLAAQEMTRGLMGITLPAGVQYIPGLEPGGPAAGIAAGLGQQFAPVRAERIPVRPAALAQAAPIGAGIEQQIQAIRQMGVA